MEEKVQKLLEIADDELILGWRNSEWTAIARQVLYEEADEARLGELKASDDPEVAGLAAKIDREEAYHRMHAQMWRERLTGEPRFEQALEELRPALEVRGEHMPDF